MQCNGSGRRKTARPIIPSNGNPTGKVRVRVMIIGYGNGSGCWHPRLADLYRQLNFLTVFCTDAFRYSYVLS